MAVNRFVGRETVSAAEAHLARVAEDGSGRHKHLANLLEDNGTEANRDLSDAIHLLCHLHGRHPGFVQLALERVAGNAAERDWLGHAADSFERERLYLVHLTAAVGPLPSTPGAAETEATLLAQRNALEVLAASERTGCALGASCALVGDWWPIRRLLDRAALRMGLDVPSPSLPDEASVIEVIELSSNDASISRAFSFGAEQLLLQHRCLFDLLEARASARAAY